MADEESREAGGEGKRRGLGYEDLSMNVVPASATAEPSEAGRRAGGLSLVVTAVVVAAVIVVLGTRLISNAHPGQEAEQRLRERLRGLAVWQSGTLLEARYLAGDRLRIGFSPRLSAAKEDERERMRSATKQVMSVLIEERPDRNLYIEGYQGDAKIVQAEYRRKSTLIGPAGEQLPDITVRVEGDPEGGMGQAYGRSARSPAGK